MHVSSTNIKTQDILFDMDSFFCWHLVIYLVQHWGGPVSVMLIHSLIGFAFVKLSVSRLFHNRSFEL